MPAKLSVKTKLGLMTDSLSKCVGVGYKLGRYMQWLQLQAACVGMGLTHFVAATMADLNRARDALGSL